MFKMASYDPKLNKLNTNLIKMKYIINKALTEIRYEENHLKGTSQKRRSQTSSQADSIDQILMRLSKGYTVMKHSVNTKVPHPKIIYLSKDLKELCWKTPDSNSEKSIPLASITRVVQENCALHIHKTSEIKDASCCFVVVSTQRNLEIQAQNELEAVVLSEQIRRATSYAKSLCQNYQYSLE